MNRKCIALATLICGCTGFAAMRAGADSQISTPDQVTVTANRDKLRKLIVQLQETEEDFYEEFNKLNVNPEFETHCELKHSHEPQVLEEVCAPKFVATASDVETPDKMADYKRTIFRLARDDAKLGKIANDYAALNMAIEAARSKK